jgi:single-strand DNA-binding protein
MNPILYRNHAHIAGFLGNDPQLRFLPGGDSVLSLRVATKSFWKDAAGEWKSATEWHTAVFYRQLADLAHAQTLKKGDFIDLEGRLHTREWQDDHNHKRVSREIIVDRFHRVDIAALQQPDGSSMLQQDVDASHTNDHPTAGGPDSLETFKKLT